MGPRSVKELIVVGESDGSPNTVGGLLGDYQRRALSHVLMKDNKASRRLGLLGLRTSILLRTKVAIKWASQLALVHCIIED